MFRPLKQVALAISALGCFSIYTASAAPAASAFTFFEDGSIGIDQSDQSKSFTVNFDGNWEGQDVAGLSSEAVFTFLGFSSVENDSKTITEARFEILLDNTSSDSLNSRSSALGFDVTDFLGESLDLLFASSSGSSSFNVGVTRSSGLFSEATSGSFPNQFGAVDVCFTDGNTCQGGKNGGVYRDDEPETFEATLALSGEVESFVMSNFGIRYQSITGEDGDRSFVGASGTGTGTVMPPSSDNPKKVPEPTMTFALLLLGGNLLRQSRKRQPELVGKGG
ncbi:cistern family PEP-CTERM protein [Oxynema sp. CENA135]|uniref:cistern family PEP-CTERM protein n=1 Tax=Oxynema sp. CENA135 TaxID=984206 RepID=UPI00190C1774|nr:cistern family PEP-CTERM protein [Oxynema sp. CENA135]MBK4729945.1 cistern family PEP-CTERM protein [Oxynema sp. CENA135]